MLKTRMITLGLFILPWSLPVVSLAEETILEKEEVAAERTGNAIKKAYRGAKDKTCKMVDGSMKCAGKKAKHKLQNAADEVSTDATELKNKAN